MLGVIQFPLSLGLNKKTADELREATQFVLLSQLNTC